MINKELYMALPISSDTILDWVSTLDPDELIDFMKEINLHMQSYDHSVQYCEWLLIQLLRDTCDDLNDMLERVLGNKFNRPNTKGKE
jgi:hypothetical protein